MTVENQIATQLILIARDYGLGAASFKTNIAKTQMIQGEFMAYRFRQEYCLHVKRKFLHRVIISDILTIVAMVIILLHFIGAV